MVLIKKFRLCAVVIAVLAVILCFPFRAVAVETDGSITLNCPVTGQSFSLYRIADINQNGYSFTEEMSGYQVELTSEAAADTLSAYIQRDNLTPLRTAVSGDERKVVFDSLTDGVYLIVGERLSKDKKVYAIKPALISVPRYIGSQEQRSVTVDCKYEVHDAGKKYIDISVIKVWKSDEGQSRPRSVTVQLLRDGFVYDIAILNSSNSWKYAWKNLSVAYEWKVVEKEVPSGYKVKIENDGAVSFTITNVGKERVTTTTAPVITQTTQPTTTGTVPGYSTPTYNTNTMPTPSAPTPTNPGDGTPEIPQTGQLWWPVTWLVIGGCLMIIIGVGIKRNS